MKEILIITTNKNKVREYKEMLEPLGYSVKSLLDYNDNMDVEENGSTFAENALIKARYGYNKYHVFSIADDSGLCIRALDNRPGIHSARFLGKDTDYTLKNKAILLMMKDKEDRYAEFHCDIALAGDKERVFEGIMEGEIAEEIKGNNGFGYDPVFLIPSLNKTSAELLPDEKNNISHRGKATKKLLAYLKENQ